MEKIDRNSVEYMGTEIQRNLDEYFEQWGGPMSFREIISKRTYFAQKLGISLDEFTRELQEKGFIRVIFDQSGKRYVYSTKCGLTPQEMLDIIIERKSKNGRPKK